MEDNEYIIIKKSDFFKIDPHIIKYDSTSKRVRSSNNSKIRRFIRGFYQSQSKEERNVLFELSGVKIHKLIPLTEEEGYLEIILENDDDAVLFFAKYDQYNVEEANRNMDSWFKGNNLENIDISYLEEIYKPCLRIDSKGRIILKCSAYFRNYSPDFEIINREDELIDFKDIIDKKVEIIFENKGLLFSSHSFNPLFFINTIKLSEEEPTNINNEEEILFKRQSISKKEKFYFNDEISLGKYKNEDTNKEIKEEIKEEINNIKEETFDDNSVDSHLEEFLESLEKNNNEINDKWLKEIKTNDLTHENIKNELKNVCSSKTNKKLDEQKSVDKKNKKIRIVKKRRGLTSRESSKNDF